jgi:hypothetical protein
MQRFALLFAAMAVFVLDKPALTQEQTAAPLPGHFVSIPIGPRGPLGAVNENSAAQASPTIPLWNGTISGFNYSMVGQSPQFSNQATFVTTPVIPLVFTFADGTTFDSTAADSTCLGGYNAAGLTMGSPIFGNYPFLAGTTNVGGPMQYLDFYQRANFWQYTSANPSYHLLLSSSQFAAIRVIVPSANGHVATGGYCGGKLGEVDINWFDSYVKTTVFAQLAALGVFPSSFPIFLASNVILYDSTPSNCCIIGYHSAFYNSHFGNAIQTYAFAEFDSSGAFGSGNRDVAALSHEVGEWLDDPLANNPTPPWGNVGQVSGCQSDLENGDPLTGTTITATMANGFNYHVQELVFFSWFYNQSPSLGVNGWYSSNGTFRSPATPCGATGAPTASLNVSSLNFSTQSLGTSSAAQSITLTNTGTATLSGIAVSLTGINPGDFSLINNCPSSLAVNTSCSVSVTFKPTVASARSATVSFADNALGSPQTVALTGTATGTPQVVLAPGGLTFLSQNVGTTSAVQSIVVTNTGTGALSFTSIALANSSGDFIETTTCPLSPLSLAAPASCSISVSFKPVAAGTRTATISIADNATGSPQSVSLSGTGASVAVGAPQVSLSPSSLTFSSQSLGTSASQIVTLTDIGAGSLTGIGISLQGGNIGDFSQSNNCIASLVQFANCSITVTFTPTSAGTRSSSISIADNATGAPQSVVLSGTGSAAPALQPYISSVSTLVVPLNQTTNVVINGFNFQSGFTATLTTSVGTIPISAAALTFVSANQIQLKVTPGGVAPFLATLTITNPGGLKASSQLFVLAF